MMDEADLVISGNSDKEGGLNLGFSLKPTKTEEGEARKKKGGEMGGALLAAIAMKIGLLKALAFKALVLLVGKALLVSKVYPKSLSYENRNPSELTPVFLISCPACSGSGCDHRPEEALPSREARDL